MNKLRNGNVNCHVVFTCAYANSFQIDKNYSDESKLMAPECKLIVGGVNMHLDLIRISPDSH